MTTSRTVDPAPRPSGSAITANEKYELGASYMAGFAAALQKLCWLDGSMALLAPRERESLEHPQQRLWWSPSTVEVIASALLAARGETAVERLGFAIVLPVNRPLVKVTSVLSRSDPTAFFRRIPDLTANAVRGLSITTDADGPQSCRVSIRYPRSPPRGNGLLWKGALARFGGAVPQHPAVLGMEQQATAFVYRLVWG